jgi:hypothetical protein
MMRFIKDDEIDVFHLDESRIQTIIQYRCCANNYVVGVEQVGPFLLPPGVQCPAMHQSWDVSQIVTEHLVLLFCKSNTVCLRCNSRSVLHLC